jgi:hypothetical protein
LKQRKWKSGKKNVKRKRNPQVENPPQQVGCPLSGDGLDTFSAFIVLEEDKVHFK